MKKTAIVAFLLVMILPSCKEDHLPISESYIHTFLVPDSFELKWYDFELYGEEYKYFSFEFKGVSYNKYNPDPDVFALLIVQYEDNQYNRYRGIPTKPALAEKINTISITATTDWDEWHPAGSSLNDYFWLSCSSAWPYVNANYRNFMEWTQIAMPLNYLGKEPLKLLAPDSFYLLFLNDPPTGELGLKVVIRGEKDYEWEGTIDFG